MDINQQLHTVESALSERMISLVFAVVREWVTELGNAELMSRMNHLENNYAHLFQYYLSADDAEREAMLDKMTLEAYRLMDEAYVELRLKRGISPRMTGFKEDNIQSVMRYFSSCVKLTDADYEWLQQLFADPDRQGMGLITLAALLPNLRECFNERMIYLLIEACNVEGKLVADQALASVILIMVHYDSRMDYYPDLQNAFVEAVGDDERAFKVICAMIGTMGNDLHQMVIDTTVNPDKVPQILHDVLEKDFGDVNLEDVVAFMPVGENEYLRDLIETLPDTWVYSTIVGEDEERERVINRVYVEAGMVNQVADDIDTAEQWLINQLRGTRARPIDYINYGHCCFIRGDRLMAYENYRQARSMCSSLHKFCELFRPTRHVLLEKGIPLEQIYLMEDNLMRMSEPGA